MITKFSKFALTVGFLLAIVFTFSCTGGGGDDGSAELSSSSKRQKSSSSLANSDGKSSSSVASSSSNKSNGPCIINGQISYDCDDIFSSSSSGRSSSSKQSSSSSSSSVGSVSSSSIAGGGVSNKCTDIANCKKKQIGSQVWLAENLNIEASGSKCYDNDPANCSKYGRLYDWSTAMALDASCNSSSCASQINTPHRGICPSGWHIPSDEEWTTLTDYVGGASTAGTKLKAREGWESYSDVPSGTDEFGFSALPGGLGYSGLFDIVGIIGYWWSATELDSDVAYSRDMYYDVEFVSWVKYNKLNLFSVRCLQD